VERGYTSISKLGYEKQKKSQLPFVPMFVFHSGEDPTL
jgi:hypothetical protein